MWTFKSHGHHNLGLQRDRTFPVNLHGQFSCMGNLGQRSLRTSLAWRQRSTQFNRVLFNGI